MSHSQNFLQKIAEIANKISSEEIDLLVEELVTLRNNGGRLFVIGVGGSAGNASHAVNDFRKLCNIEAYAPTDNVAELTARANDEGWETIFSEWLKISRLCEKDAILVLSVGGGNLERNVSVNIAKAVDLATERNARVLGIVGRDGGYTKKHSRRAILIPVVEEIHVTPHAEAFQAVIWHCLVSHPKLQVLATKW